MHADNPDLPKPASLSVNIRPGCASDLNRCAEIWMRAAAMRDGTEHDPSVRTRALTKLVAKGSVLYVVEYDNEIHGFALAIDTASPGESRSAHLSLLAVDPIAQGSGLGRFLIQKISNALGRDGFDEVTLNVLQDNAAARKIYDGAGWQESGRGEFKDSGRQFVSYVLPLCQRD